MTYESEWDGFVTQAGSAVPEALYAAGVDCSVHEHGNNDRTPVAVCSSDD